MCIGQDTQEDHQYYEGKVRTNYILKARGADQSWNEGHCMYACMYIVVCGISGEITKFWLTVVDEIYFRYFDSLWEGEGMTVLTH